VSDHPSDPRTPNGTYETTQLDIAAWFPSDPGSHEGGEWELRNYHIATPEEGRKRLEATRRAHPSMDREHFRLVQVDQTTTITDLGEADLWKVIAFGVGGSEFTYEVEAANKNDALDEAYGLHGRLLKDGKVTEALGWRSYAQPLGYETEK
jgi:hypothetical protein